MFDRGFSIVLIILGVSLTWHSYQIDFVKTDPLGMMAFPRTLSVLLIILGATLLVTSMRNSKSCSTGTPGWIIVAVIVTTSLYTIAIETVGFLIASPIFFMLISMLVRQSLSGSQWWQLGSAITLTLRDVRLWIVAILLSSIIYGIFAYLLTIPLP